MCTAPINSIGYIPYRLLFTRADMITKVSISNFKSIREIKDLKLKPLTILTGVNSSGKSNIMETISFFAQASRYRKAHTQDPNVHSVFRNGDLKTYPREIENLVVYKRSRRRKVAFEINLEVDRTLTNDIEASLVKSDEARRYIFVEKNQTEIETVGYSFSFRLSDRAYSQGINACMFTSVITESNLFTAILRREPAKRNPKRGFRFGDL